MRDARCAFGGAIARALACAVLVALLSGAARASDDPKAASADLSNQAFALLNGLNAPNSDGSVNADAKALVGPIASFAGDAQTLSQALDTGDNAGARRATAALDADAASVDAALRAHRGAIAADRWNALKHRLAAIEKTVPPAAASVAPPAPPGASAAPSAPPPAPAASSAEAAPAPGPDSGGPTVKIESRRMLGDVTQIKGYIEGAGLQSAGIYEGNQGVKPIDVGNVAGRQRVDFQLKIRGADISTNLRAYDRAGRMASASVFGEDSSAMASTGRESGVEVDRGAGATSGGNTVEIPSASAPALGGPEGSAPAETEGGPTGGLAAPMGSIQINIESVNALNSLTHVYQVTGQIVGHGVHRAGVYVDGRLVKRLPVSRGANVSNFQATFMMNGASATIRAFGSGNQYVESSIQMPPAMASSPPIVVAPYGVSPYSPYGVNPYGVSPYGVSPYGVSPYGVSPYGVPYGGSPSYGINISPHGITTYPISPYGASPYGAVPYGVNPYAPPINPYNSNVRPMGPAGR